MKEHLVEDGQSLVTHGLGDGIPRLRAAHSLSGVRRERDALLRIVEREISDERVIEAFRSLARDAFVPEGSEEEAFEDRPVPLPRCQTTSQPSLIARMVEASAPRPGDSVLEIGTGYGFQTALLARLATQVVSLERHGPLAEAARTNLARAGIANAEVIVADGWQGWARSAPYDAIVVSAAADEIPPALAGQLAEGGRLVLPLRHGGSDDVVLFVKRDGELTRERLITPARFVPLVHGIDDA